MLEDVTLLTLDMLSIKVLGGLLIKRRKGESSRESWL